MFFCINNNHRMFGSPPPIPREGPATTKCKSYDRDDPSVETHPYLERDWKLLEPEVEW